MEKQLTKKITELDRDLEEKNRVILMLKEELTKKNRKVTEPELNYRQNVIMIIAIAVVLIVNSVI